MIHRVLLFMSLLAPASIADARAPKEGRVLTGQQKFEHRLFVNAGFIPIEYVRATGRDVRRLLLSDPYGFLPIPGLELERRGDGRVTMRAQYRGYSSDPVEVDRAIWPGLTAHDKAVFSKTERASGNDSTPNRSPLLICHGWTARLEADEELVTSWAQCGGQESPAYRYAARLAEIAVTSKANCSYSPKDPFWSFQKCFGPKDALDDPTLESEYAVLRKDYIEAPGADRLAEARLALRKEPLVLGNAAWRNALAAVAKVKAIHDLRKDRLLRLQKLAANAHAASAADKVKMAQTIEQWSNFIKSTERNYSELLERLVLAPLPAETPR